MMKVWWVYCFGFNLHRSLLCVVCAAHGGCAGGGCWLLVLCVHVGKNAKSWCFANGYKIRFPFYAMAV